MVVKRFRMLTSKCSRTDWCFLLSWRDLNRAVYVYNHKEATAVHPNHPGTPTVPWPIVWVLARHSGKHRFLSPAYPKVQSIHQAVERFADKVAWQYHFRHSSPNPLPFKIKRVQTVKYSGIMPPELKAWTNSLKKKVHEAAVQAITAVRSMKTHYWSNTPKLVQHALQMLYDRQWSVLKSDKDGGMVLVDANFLKCEFSRHLPADKYKPVPTWEPFNSQESILGGFRRLVNEITIKSDDPSIKALLHRDVVARGAGAMASPLTATVKTHKQPGAVTLRIIHDCSNHPFQHMSRWISSMIRPWLSQFSHIAKDTRTMLALLGKEDFAGDDVIMKGDVAEYFMSSSHEKLAAGAASFAPARMKDLVRDAVIFLLYWQYVTPQKKGESLKQLFRVIRGAGMGFPCSGDIADACFLREVEYFMLDVSIRTQLRIKFYSRCKDDLLIVLENNENSLDEIRRRFRDQDSGFQIKQWDVSRDNMTFLDILLYKGQNFQNSGQFSYRTSWKASSLGVPLDAQSAHHPSIDIAWKLAELQRVSLTCSCHRNFLDAKGVILDRLRRYYDRPSTIKLLEESDPYRERQLRDALRVKQTVVTPEKTHWLVLPYHPVWYSMGLNKLLREHVASWDPIMASIGFMQVRRIRASWKHTRRNLGQFIHTELNTYG